MATYINYAVSFNTYNANGFIESNCIDLTFINFSSDTVMIDTFPLQPNQSLPINGNIGEYTNQRFFIKFAAGETAPNLVVIRRVYQNI